MSIWPVQQNFLLYGILFPAFFRNNIVLFQAGALMLFRKFLMKPLCMKTAILSLIAVLCVYGLHAGAAFAQAANQRDVPPATTFGAWSKACVLPIGTPNIMCELTQSARAKDRPDISFRVSFIRLPQEEGTLLRVIVPIRVELPLGVGIKIDGDKDMGSMPYRRCLGESCVAEALLDDKDMRAFLEGKAATFFIFTTPEEGIGGIIDLTGIKAGYTALP